MGSGQGWLELGGAVAAESLASPTQECGLDHGGDGDHRRDESKQGYDRVRCKTRVRDLMPWTGTVALEMEGR